MLGTMVKYGLIGGAVVGAAMISLVLLLGGHDSGVMGMVLGYLSMLIALTAVFMGVKHHRDEALGGVIRFWPAFGLGLAISLIAALVYILAWEATLVITGMDFTNQYADAMIRQARQQGLRGPALAKAIADAESFRIMYAKPLVRMTITFTEIFPVGLLVSLLSAAVLRNPRVLAKRS